MVEIVVRNKIYNKQEVKKTIINNTCNGGINCKCAQTRDFDKDITTIENLGYNSMAEFNEK